MRGRILPPTVCTDPMSQCDVLTDFQFIKTSGKESADLGAVKALANEDTLLRTPCCSWCFLGARQHECCVSMLRKLVNICWGHKMFLNKIRNIFCVRNKCCACGQTGKHLCRQQCVRKNMSSFAAPSWKSLFYFSSIKEPTYLFVH